MKIFWLAVATSIATFVLLLVGGTVNPTGSSLACPDWPTCYGSFFPEMTGGVLFEHSHRIAATIVGLLSIGIAALAWKTSARWLAVAALALVVFQGVLGGVTVILRLPTVVSTSHLAIAMLFFSLTIFLAFRVRPGATEGTESLAKVRRLAAIAFALVYAQIVLGGLVRHTLSGRACLDLPLCGGEWWPAHGPAALHMLHRYVAVAVLVAVVAHALLALKALQDEDRPIAKLAAALAPWIALLQMAVGVLMVHRKIEWVSAMAHTGIAALLLGAFVVLYVGAGPLADPKTMKPVTAEGPGLLRDLVALTKPSVTGMNILMTLGGLAMAGVGADWTLIALTVLGTSGAVASANALNMVWERDGDKLMARTAGRPLPTGRMSPAVAALFGVVIGICGVALLAMVNLTTAGLGLFALLSYVLVYTPMKRRAPLSLLVGAVPGAIPPLMGWTAVTGRLDLPGLVLFGILLVWQLPHFIAIALYRKADYARAGIKTVPVVRGDAVAKAQAIAWCTALVPLSLMLVPLEVAGWFYGTVALGLGVWFLAWSLKGLKRGAGAPWARKFFFASLIYLPVLVLALALDVALL